MVERSIIETMDLRCNELHGSGVGRAQPKRAVKGGGIDSSANKVTRKGIVDNSALIARQAKLSLVGSSCPF